MSFCWMYADGWLGAMTRYNPLRWSKAVSHPAELVHMLETEPIDRRRPVIISANGLQVGPKSVDEAIADLFQRCPPESLAPHLHTVVGKLFPDASSMHSSRAALELLGKVDSSMLEPHIDVIIRLCSDLLGAVAQAERATAEKALADNKPRSELAVNLLNKLDGPTLAPHIGAIMELSRQDGGGVGAKRMLCNTMLCKIHSDVLKRHIPALINHNLSDILMKLDSAALEAHIPALIDRRLSDVLMKLDSAALEQHIPALINRWAFLSDVLMKLDSAALEPYIPQLAESYGYENVLCSLDADALKEHVPLLIEHRRAQALMRLTAEQVSEGLPHLAKMVEDANHHRREKALAGLRYVAALYPSDGLLTPYIPQLIQRLRDASEDVVLKALNALAAAPASAMGPYTSQLEQLFQETFNPSKLRLCQAAIPVVVHTTNGVDLLLPILTAPQNREWDDELGEYMCLQSPALGAFESLQPLPTKVAEAMVSLVNDTANASNVLEDSYFLCRVIQVLSSKLEPQALTPLAGSFVKLLTTEVNTDDCDLLIGGEQIDSLRDLLWKTISTLHPSALVEPLVEDLLPGLMEGIDATNGSDDDSDLLSRALDLLNDERLDPASLPIAHAASAALSWAFPDDHSVPDDEDEEYSRSWSSNVRCPEVCRRRRQVAEVALRCLAKSPTPAIASLESTLTLLTARFHNDHDYIVSEAWATVRLLSCALLHKLDASKDGAAIIVRHLLDANTRVVALKALAVLTPAHGKHVEPILPYLSAAEDDVTSAARQALSHVPLESLAQFAHNEYVLAMLEGHAGTDDGVRELSSRTVMDNLMLARGQPMANAERIDTLTAKVFAPGGCVHDDIASATMVGKRARDADGSSDGDDASSSVDAEGHKVARIESGQ